MSQLNFIKCPYCGREYTPSEIYVPKYFFGYPYNIMRNEKEEIIGFNGSDMDVNESFICDKCNNLFNISCQISFKTSKTEIGNFDEDFTIKVE
nr:MAG TPA: Trm112p-like protein [Caudoviricetes sp.]